MYSKPSWGIEEVDCWYPIDNEIGRELEVPFLEEEIKKTVFECDGLGPDGFTLALYQDCWDIVKGNLMKVLNEFFE